MTKKFEQVYQFKITLGDIEPEIWRRIQVPENYTFWDLHVAIQDAMGWFDCHLHEFTFDTKRLAEVYIGIPDEDGDDFGRTILAGWETPISKIYHSKTQPVYILMTSVIIGVTTSY